MKRARKAPPQASWLIPLNTAILFVVLCVWALQEGHVVWAIVTGAFALVNAFFVYRWVRMRAPR